MLPWRRRRPAAKPKEQSFHEAMGLTLVLGQVFALLPVDGVAGPTEDRLRFSWKSWKVGYVALLVAWLLVPMYASLYDAFTTRVTLAKITAVVFFANSIAVHLLFVGMARSWPQMMDEWRAVEVAMKSYGCPHGMNFRLKTMTAIMLSTATVEHVLAVIENFVVANKLKTDERDIYECFFVAIAFPQVFRMVEYSAWLGTVMQVITFASTFSWTYIDLFISLLGAGLAQRLQQVAEKVEFYVEEKVISATLWREAREDYVRLCKLCKKTNDRLSHLILLSFSSNLFYVLVQLFHSLNYVETAVEKVYFCFSFGFLLGRTMCVCLYGAWILEEGRRPLLSLNSVSSGAYNVEIKRFILHICFDPPCLNGKHFFVITRGLILSIAGAIMTYELVLIQTFK